MLGQDAADSGAQRRYRGRTRWTAADDRGYRSALQPSSHSASRPTAYNLLGPGKLAPWAMGGASRANSAIFKVRDFACFCGSKYVLSM